jgi:hypothetical protein
MGKGGKTSERGGKIGNKSRVQKKERQGSELSGKNIRSMYAPSWCK